MMSEDRASKRARWRAVVDRQAESGESVAAFCRAQGIALWKFMYWKRRLEGGIPKAPSVDGGAVLFDEVRLAPESSASAGGVIEVALPSGVVVRLRGGVDEAALRRVLEVARSC